MPHPIDIVTPQVLLQGNHKFLAFFHYVQLVLTEQPTHSKKQILVGLDFTNFLQLLSVHRTVLVEGIPNRTCSDTNLLNHFFLPLDG